MTNNRNQALGAILRAVDEKRLPHALLLKGRNIGSLKTAAAEIAAKLLETETDKVFDHPDFFLLQARNKMRQISVSNTRDLIRKIQHSPNAGDRKVALVMEADRMNMESANAFLKTLEEPPLNTSIILTTAKPNALLDTIISRCLSFWFSEPEPPIENELWVGWKEHFTQWLESLPQPPTKRQDISERMMRLYGILEGFQVAQAELTQQKWEIEKELLPEQTSDEEMVAIEVGVSRSVRGTLLTEIETCVRDFSVARIAVTEGDASSDIASRMEHCTKELEYLKGLLEVNLNESKMMEVFLLKTLRIWSAR